MINSASANPYTRHTGSSTNVQAPKDYSYKTPEQQGQYDIYYILDISGINSQEEQKSKQADEDATILELSKESQKKLKEKALNENERAEAAETDEDGDAARPEDKTRSLTRALVLAKTRDQVQSVLADAYDHMREWQGLAATGDKEAIKVVRKIGRLIARGNRKITDLNKEIVLHQKQQKAEANEKKQEAKRLELELKEALRERKARERRYLQERDDSNNDEEESQIGPTMAETEAKIRQLSAQMAALKTSTGNAGASGVSGASGGTGSGDAVMTSGDGGIESADVSGGETSDEE